MARFVLYIHVNQKIKHMTIEIKNENKQYWYWNRKGLVCKVINDEGDYIGKPVLVIKLEN